MRQKIKLLASFSIFLFAAASIIAIMVTLPNMQFTNAHSAIMPEYFDGQEYFLINAKLPTNFTVSMWVFYTYFSNHTGVLMSEGVKNDQHSGWYIGSGGEFNNSTSCGIFSNAKTNGNMTAGWRFAKTSFIGIGKWYNLVCTYNGSYVSLYIDGKLANKSATPFREINTSIIEIGKRTSEFYTNGKPSYDPFFGYMTDINVYQNVLNDSEISTLYKDGIGSEPYAPYMHMPFENGSRTYTINGIVRTMQSNTIQMQQP